MSELVELPGTTRSEESPGGAGLSTRLSAVVERGGTGLVLVLAPAATVYLSFNNGGYFPHTVGLITIVFCAALLLRTLLAEHPFSGFNRSLLILVGALAAFALLQLVSGFWSDTAARSLDAFDRTFLYVLVFALYGSLPQSPARVRWLIRLLALAFASVSTIALVSRLLPHLWPTPLGFYSDRLSYPLGYWNALGMVGTLSLVLLAHLSCSLGERRPVRVLAAGLMPISASMLLLTYSRGCVATAILGLVVYIVVARPPGLAATLLAVLAPCAIALKAAYDAVALSSVHPRSPAGLAEGRHVAVVVVAATAAALVIRFMGLWLDPIVERRQPLARLARRLPRRRTELASAAIILALLFATGAPAWTVHQVDRFLNDNAAPTVTHARQRLTDASSNGRVVMWQVALHEFRMHPLLGGGAGTYANYSNRYRTDSDVVTDAHSLYLQTLGESGIIGLVALCVALAGILVAFARRLRRPQRSVAAVLLAAGVASLVHNAVDWDWQMPAIMLWLFAAGGLGLSAGIAHPRTYGPPPRNRTALAVGWMVLAVAPLLVGMSYQRLRSSSAALSTGNCSAARHDAFLSISLMAVRPQAYEIIGYCDLEEGYPAEGLAAMKKALSYDRQDWDYHYGLAIAQAANDLDPRPEASLAQRLAPQDGLPAYEVKAFRNSTRDGWQLLAQNVLVYSLEQHSLSVSNL